LIHVILHSPCDPSLSFHNGVAKETTTVLVNMHEGAP